MIRDNLQKHGELGELSRIESGSRDPQGNPRGPLSNRGNSVCDSLNVTRAKARSNLTPTKMRFRPIVLSPSRESCRQIVIFLQVRDTRLVTKRACVPRATSQKPGSRKRAKSAEKFANLTKQYCFSRAYGMMSKCRLFRERFLEIYIVF